MIGSLHALVRSYTRYLFSLVSGSLVRDFDFFLGFCVALENRRGEGRELAQSQLWSHTHTYKRTFTKNIVCHRNIIDGTRSWKMWNTLSYGCRSHCHCHIRQFEFSMKFAAHGSSILNSIWLISFRMWYGGKVGAELWMAPAVATINDDDDDDDKRQQPPQQQ